MCVGNCRFQSCKNPLAKHEIGLGRRQMANRQCERGGKKVVWTSTLLHLPEVSQETLIYGSNIPELGIF